MDDLVTTGVEDLTQDARRYLQASSSNGTQRRYKAAWQGFVDWCLSTGNAAMPASPATVAAYVSFRAASSKAATLGVDLAAIAHHHRAADHDNPCRTVLVERMIAGVRRVKGTAQTQRAALTTPLLQTMCESMPQGLQGVRDKALLLLGMAAGERRSEIVALDVEHIAHHPAGIVISLQHSKTDQEGKGTEIAVRLGQYPATCPVMALQAWLDAAEIESGAVWRSVRRGGHVTDDRLSGRAVHLIVRRWTEAAGLESSDYGAHSLRAGLATQMAHNKCSSIDIQTAGRWSAEMVKRYVRHADPFASAPDLGL